MQFIHAANLRLHALTIAFALLLGGCASPTTVHIYAKYFEKEDLQPLVKNLEENQDNVFG